LANSLSEGLVIHPEDTLHNSESLEKAQDWFEQTWYWNLQSSISLLVHDLRSVSRTTHLPCARTRK